MLLSCAMWCGSLWALPHSEKKNQKMSDEELIRSSGLKFGKFNGKETVKYVDNVLEHYSVFCRICPA